MGRRMYTITLKTEIGNMTLEHFKLDFNGIKHGVSVNVVGNFLDHPRLTNDMIRYIFLY